MKVLFISEYYPPKIMGGGEINLKQVAEALAKSDIEVSVLTSIVPGLNKTEVKPEIVNLVKIYRNLKTGERPQGIINNLKRSLIFPKSVTEETIRLHRKNNFDKIHFIGTSLIAAKELRKLRMPLFATIESYPALCPKGDRMYCGEKECKYVCSFSKFLFCQMQSSEIGKTKNSWYLKYNPVSWLYVYNFYSKLNHSLKYCHLIAISEYVQKVLLQHKLKSAVIPNIIDLKMFEKAKKEVKDDPKDSEKLFSVNILEALNYRIFNASPNSKSTNLCSNIKCFYYKQTKKLKIIYLGSLTKYKGPQVLLNAIIGINCRCDLYGEGPLKEELLQSIKKNKLDAEIHAPVPYEKTPEIYAQADLVVFPSLWPEPFGRIAVEALAAGKPVIGSEIGGIKETIEKGTGLFFSPGNSLKLHQMFLKIFKKEDIFMDLNQKTVKNKFNPEAVTIKLINNYKKRD